MRLSVLPEDPGYPNTWKHNPYTCRVLLDGERVEDCVTADEEEGYVVRGGAVRRGKVELVWDG